MRSGEYIAGGASLPVPELSIIIPVHNQWRLTRFCIESLLRFPPDCPFEIIVVDDGSTDETAASLAEWCLVEPRLNWLQNSPPHRFAAACNCGARVARGELLLFLNNDIEVVEADWFAALREAIRQPGVGIVAPRLLFPDGTIQHCGKVWQLDDAGLPRSEHYLYQQAAELPEAGRSGFFITITGACMLVKCEQFFRCGPFDERYENGWEDDDLCLSFRSQGLLAWVCGDSSLIHHQGGTLKAEADVLERYLGLLRSKGLSLDSDDPFVAVLRQRMQERAARFEGAWQRNRDLFVHKWGAQLAELLSTEQNEAITVVIVTYNSAATIATCLESLAQVLNPCDFVVVVDNRSRDNTVEQVRRFGTALVLRVIENDTNRGYAAAANQGLDCAETPLVLLLNPDTVLTPGVPGRLAKHLHRQEVAAVGPISNFAAGRQSVDRHWHGALPSRISPQDAAAQIFSMNQGTSEESALLIGFCLMLRRTVLQQVGLLDERLFLGNDDLELCWRLRLHGYRLLIARDCFVYHEGQHSFRTDPATVTGELVRQSSSALYNILESCYGAGRVPAPEVLWGVDWFEPDTPDWNRAVVPAQVIFMPVPYRLPHLEQKPLVSIVMLTFNQWECTEACLVSIAKHTPEPYELIIVDNGSCDGTVDRLRQSAAADRRIKLVLNSENRGYAAGCNQGLQIAQGEYLLLLNNDVLVTPEWLAGLLECQASHAQAGIVGPMTNSASGSQVVPHVSYDTAQELDRFALSYRIRNRYRRVPCRRVVGFCMLFHRSLIAKIGALDEQFGTGNYEDDDFCLRAAVAGYQNLLAGDVFIHHYGSASFKANNIDYRAALTRNAALFHKKWSSPVGDRQFSERIAACRLRQEIEDLLLDEQFDAARAKAHSGVAKHPGDLLMLDLQMRLGSSADDGALRLLYRSERARAEGFDEYADALLLAGFRLEPWRPELISALLQNSEQGMTGLALQADEAFRLYPASRGLSRLRSLLACREMLPEALEWAEAHLAAFGPDDRVLTAGLPVRRSIGPYRGSAVPGRSVSLCMIVRDEERHIARCLASCKPLVHELVVVDTGSNDRTAVIAELFGAQLHSFPWNDDFSAARNYSLEYAGSDWILVMDADEAVSVRDYAMFEDVLSKSAPECAFSLTTRNYTNNASLEGFLPCRGEYPEHEAGSGWTPSDKIRLFPNRRGIQFSGSIHEMVETSVQAAGLAVGKFPAQVHHYGGLDTARCNSKREHYLVLGLKKLSEEPSDAKALYELAVQAAELEQFEIAERLWRNLLNEQPAFARGWFNLGFALLRQARVGEALSATERALELEPDFVDAVVNCAICEACLTQGEEALRSAARAQGRYPDNPALLGLTALALYRVGMRSEGRQAIRMLVTAGRDICQLLDGIVAVMRKQGGHPDLAAVLQASADASSASAADTASTSCCS